MLNTKLLINTNIHREAIDWHNRVITNGGRVSKSTLKAVSDFCNRIDAAGIRDKFYRLNLFCGNQLSAALVPLYLGSNYGGTKYGNTTDTNVNFVSGDYSESVGLNANSGAFTTTKYLDTGLSPDGMPTRATGHASVFRGAGNNSSGINLAMIGSRVATAFYYIRQLTSTNTLSFSWGGGTMVAGSEARTGVGLVLMSRTSSTQSDIYFNTTSDAAQTGTVVPPANDNAFVVFNFRQTNGTVSTSGGWPYVISAYSIGAAMSGADVTAFHTALTTFLAALGRPTT